MDNGSAPGQTLAFGGDVTTLVELVAPDLRTLVLINNSLELPPSLAHAPRFPQLREFTIVDPHGQLEFAPALCHWMIQTTPEVVVADGKEVQPCFPLLERLNMLGCREVLDLRHWVNMAPRLTHLRISHLSPFGCEMVYQVLESFRQAVGEYPVQLASPKSEKDG